jgi:hypothetical protein
MRTSIKILIAALTLVIVGLLVYDTQLKAAYLKGDYKKPFGDFVVKNYNNFNSIELQSGTAINLKVVKGPYKVMVDPTVGDFVKISQQGKKLIISAEFKDHYRALAGEFVVFVSCPELKSFISDARYTAGGWLVTDSVSNMFTRLTRISGFSADSLIITENNASNIALDNDHIGYLKATLGAAPNTGSQIAIGAGNDFGSALFDVQNKSKLFIQSYAGNNITYHIADSAQLVVSGAISKQLFKTIQP